MVKNKKYTLQKMGDGYSIRANLSEERMKELVEKMRQAGYRYDPGKKEFVEMKQ